MSRTRRAHAYVGLGANLADPRRKVEAALTAIATLPHTRLVRHSSLYRSAPWGVADQPEFVNAAAQIETALSPPELMQALLGIERDFGRERSGDRWGPRVIDLDLLVYADRVIDEPGLHVPHPHLHERAFVLVPLAEIAPGLEVPGKGPVSGLLAQIDASACRLLEPGAPATG
jgi:2-amino-4-hydroxy-6-hydroxymethyldihydropteridine diphosphokinase